MRENKPSTEMAKPKNAPPRRKKLLKAACWIAVFAAGIAAGGLLYGVYSRPPDSPLNYPAIEEKLTSIQNTIADNYLFPVDQGSLENGIYHGLLDGLNDPYSVYFTPDEWAALKQEYAANYCGIGAEIQMDGTSNTKLRIIYDDSPALRAGLRVGDVILEVDGVSVEGMTLEALAREYIMGEPGTEVSLGVYRPETGQTLLLTAVRAPIVVKTVESRMLADSTGYLRVQDFYDTTADEFIEQCGQLEQQGMQRLIIDLRDNPGGSLDAVVQMRLYSTGRGFPLFPCTGEIHHRLHRDEKRRYRDLSGRGWACAGNADQNSGEPAISQCQ